RGCYTNRAPPQPSLPSIHRRPACCRVRRQVLSSAGVSFPPPAQERPFVLAPLSRPGPLLGDLAMPDLGALLWPRTVALIGASGDGESLRGRIFNVMRGHAFTGELYPVSRSNAEVLGRKAYPSVADLPRPADLAVIIIPAKHVAEELE